MQIVIGYDKNGKKIVKEVGPVLKKKLGRRDGREDQIFKGMAPWNPEAIF